MATDLCMCGAYAYPHTRQAFFCKEHPRKLEKEKPVSEQQHYFSDPIQALEDHQEYLSRNRSRANEVLGQANKAVIKLTKELDEAQAQHKIAKDKWDEVNEAMGKNKEAISALKNHGSSTPNKESF